ncbi:thioredoxin-like protein [Ganoderma leucocontextum]|nr:thioredoxin-like protein [Ganoderma leucocontextum]
MVLKVYGHPLATNGQRVLIVIEELNVPHELITVDFDKMEHKSPEYLAHQPFGQLPYIEDDGIEIFESRAICRYLALKYGGIGTLIPAQSDLEKTAKFEQAASVELNNFEGPMWQLTWECKYKLFIGLETDVEAAQVHRTRIEGKLDGYEAMLSKTRFLAGDEVTLVDLFHLPHEAFLKDQGFDFVTSESSRWPNVARCVSSICMYRWWKEVTGRPSWQKVITSVKTN